MPKKASPHPLRELCRLLALVLFSLLASACAQATPLCEAAGVQLEQGAVGASAELYARAGSAGEGDCSSAGIAAAGEAYSRAYVEAARGAQSEAAGNVADARSAYQSALQIDTSNGAALAGLTRLRGAPAQMLQPTVISIPTSPPPPWWETAWPLVIGAGLLVLVSGGLAFYVSKRLSDRISESETISQSSAKIMQASRDKVEQVSEQSSEVSALVGQLESRLDDSIRREESLREDLESYSDDAAEDRINQRNRLALVTARVESLDLRTLATACQLAEDAYPESAVQPRTAGRSIDIDAVPAVWTGQLTRADSHEPELEGAPRELAPVPEQPVVYVLSCRGTQVGEGNRQFNLFKYSLEDVRIDLSDLLKPTRITKALQVLAREPESASALRGLEKAIGASARRAPALTIDLGEHSSAPITRAEEDLWNFLDRTVVVHGSEAVQIGNSSRQHNRFVYSLSPEIESLSLIRENPSIVRAIAREISDGGEQLPAALTGAMRRTLSGFVELRAGEVEGRGERLRMPAAGEALVVRGLDGIQIGSDRQRNKVEATCEKIGTLIPTEIGEMAAPTARAAEPSYRIPRDRVWQLWERETGVEPPSPRWGAREIGGMDGPSL